MSVIGACFGMIMCGQLDGSVHCVQQTQIDHFVAKSIGIDRLI